MLGTFFLVIILVHAHDPEPDQTFLTDLEEQIHNDFEECKMSHGLELAQCMQKLSSEEQKKIIKELTPQQRKDYLSYLTLPDYDQFLDNYNEYEWARLLKYLTTEEQCHWPKTVHEQRESIVDIKERATYGCKKYQVVAFLTNLVPYGKETREHIEKACYEEIPLPERIKKGFNEYMQEKFKL
jgi:hypothetical protein